MNDKAALLAAIAAQPEEDTPRLAFADLLDESGEADDRARAALIRSMCKHHYLVHRPQFGAYARTHGQPRLTAATARKLRLWLWDDLTISTHRYRVKDRTFVLSARGRDNGEWRLPRRSLVRRGFVDEVHWPLDDLQVFGKSVFLEHPVTQILLTDKRPYLNDAPAYRDHPWSWATSSGHASHWAFPVEFDSLLTGHQRREDDWWWYYPTSEAAYEDASRAAVDYARSLAGLAPLYRASHLATALPTAER